MPIATYVWPGLVQIADRGSWSGLASACGFAALVNLAAVSSFVWRELLPYGLRTGLWVAVGVSWLAAVAYSMVGRKRRAALKIAGPLGGETLEQGISHYLKGNWFEAERVLVGLLHFDEADVEARLMLATLLRRRRRYGEAAGQLDQIEQLQRAAKWELEIRRERLLLKEACEEFEAEKTEVLAPNEGAMADGANGLMRAA